MAGSHEFRASKIVNRLAFQVKFTALKSLLLSLADTMCIDNPGARAYVCNADESVFYDSGAIAGRCAGDCDAGRPGQDTGFS